MTYPLGTFNFKDIFHEIRITNVSTVDAETLFRRVLAAKKSQVGFFDAHIIVIVHLVDDNHIITTFKKVLGHMGPNKASSSSH